MADLGPAELRLMQGLAQQVTALRPEVLNGDSTVGELAWVWGQTYDALHQFWRHRLWFDDDRLVGWGWVRLPYRVRLLDGSFRESKEAGLTWQVHPDRTELFAEILDWYDEEAGNVDRLVIVQSPDTEALAIVAAHGYAFDEEDGSDTGDWVQWNTRDLVDIADPVLPDGFRFLTAGDVSVANAVEVHRAAWQPSSFTEVGLERVRLTWPYRDDLHVLVAGPNGTLAATAIIWLDEATQTAEFEPVGTHPDYRRRGLGRALQLHGMHRARAAGAKNMFVACLGAPAHPAARAMYYDVGFRELSRDVPYVKVA